MGSIRSQLGAVIQERSRVTELLCHSVGSAYYFARSKALSNSRGRHTKTLSAPPVFLGKGEELTVDQDTGKWWILELFIVKVVGYASIDTVCIHLPQSEGVCQCKGFPNG